MTLLLIHRRLLVVVGRSEVHLDICVDDTDSIIVVLGFDLENVDFVVTVESLNGDGVAHMEAGEVPQLDFEDGLGVGQLDELREVRLQLDVAVFLAFL